MCTCTSHAAHQRESDPNDGPRLKFFLEIAEREEGNPVAKFAASRITIMEITNAVRQFLILGATCACAIWLKEADYRWRGAAGWRGGVEMSWYRHENDHLSGFINFLDGAYYVWRIVRRWNKAKYCCQSIVCSVTDIKSIAQR